MFGCFGGNSNEDRNKGDQGGIERNSGDLGEESSDAVEQKCKPVYHLVGNDSMPWLRDAISMVVSLSITIHY